MRGWLSLSGLVVFVVGLVLSGPVQAERGVGVNLGRIDISDRLAPGSSYQLPLLGVVNTGSEPDEYEVVITHLDDQSRMRPSPGWFDIQPQHFLLNAGQSQNVRILLDLPTGADPGDYFAFIEAHPVAEGSGTPIGVAAATRLSFSVKPSSWLEAQRERLDQFLSDNEPWSKVIPAGILLTLFFLALLRFFRVRLKVERR